NDGGANAAAENLAFVRRVQQFIHERDATFETPKQLVLGFLRDVFLREINIRFDMREGLQHIIAELIDALGKLSSKLFVGGAQSEFGARMNYIGNGLGLREVNAAVQECAAGKLARLG